MSRSEPILIFSVFKKISVFRDSPDSEIEV